ncbi:MAG: ECF-type sigma factor [Bryobacteraceae bacterium]
MAGEARIPSSPRRLARGSRSPASLFGPASRSIERIHVNPRNRRRQNGVASRAITRLLEHWHAGDKEAANRPTELVYGELHRIASREMRREHGEHTLQTTALVHEVYLRLCGTSPIDWKDRSHFFAVAARQLRHVLVDHARRLNSEKRGNGIGTSPEPG